jgi:hypothetical protein
MANSERKRGAVQTVSSKQPQKGQVKMKLITTNHSVFPRLVEISLIVKLKM